MKYSDTSDHSGAHVFETEAAYDAPEGFAVSNGQIWRFAELAARLDDRGRSFLHVYRRGRVLYFAFVPAGSVSAAE